MSPADWASLIIACISGVAAVLAHRKSGRAATATAILASAMKGHTSTVNDASSLAQSAIQIANSTKNTAGEIGVVANNAHKLATDARDKSEANNRNSPEVTTAFDTLNERINALELAMPKPSQRKRK